ncbi:hypothetical protein MN0502_20740 [Arthrobacter sp. MN05-02]|nr:hypothetical protein MN0502_20740 [Arthrobacter sp. MN05-02]
MARIDSSRRWYLFDYGNVLSTAPTPQDWELLAEATGVEGLHGTASPYWEHRHAYDLGALTSEDYWSLVTGSRVGSAGSAWLDVLDGNQWSHLNLDTLDVLEDLDARGERLALLSNMPAAMVAQLGDVPWTRLFRHRFFSSSLRLVKPSTAVFDHVLTELAVEPGLVTFVDDSPANVAAARALGFDARLFEPASDLARVLADPAPVRALSSAVPAPGTELSPPSPAAARE